MNRLQERSIWSEIGGLLGTRSLVVVLALSLAWAADAQTTTEIIPQPVAAEHASPTGLLGAGFPLNRSVEDQRYQTTVMAPDLIAAGLVANRQIIALQIRCAAVPTTTVLNLRLRLGMTASGSMATFATAAAFTHGSTAISLAPSQMPSGQWIALSLTTAMTWDGSSNLLVDITSDGVSGTSLDGTVFLRPTAVGRSIRGASDSQYPWPFDAMPTGSLESATLALRVSHAAPLTITSSSSLGATSGSPYTTALTSIGGVAGPRTWSVTSGTLPVGMTLAPATGVISGVAVVGQTTFSTFTVTVADGVTTPASMAISFQIANGPLTWLGPMSATLYVGSPASTQLLAVGGLGPLSYSLGTSQTLPPGLSLSSGGLVFGTPTTVGSWVVIFIASDGVQQQNFATSFQVNPPPVSPVAMTMGALPTALAGISYLATLSATGGSGAYTWSIAPGSPAQLPTGLSLIPGGAIGVDGQITGVPTVAGLGSRVIGLRVTDAATFVDLTFVLTIERQVPVVGATALPAGIVGIQYSSALSATLGVTPYSWSLAPLSPALPAGLSLSTGGQLTGIPLSTVAVAPEFRVTDAVGTAASLVMPMNVVDPLIMLTSSLQSGAQGALYSTTLSATGGLQPLVWSVTSGALPPGLGLSPAGVLSGTPLIVGVYSFTVRVADGVPQQASWVFQVSIAAPLSISPPALPMTSEGSPYTHVMVALGGVPPYSWSVVSGSLPPGLLLAVGGVITGVTGTGSVGTYQFVLEVTDTPTAPAAPPGSAQVSAVITVLSVPVPPVILTASLPNGAEGAVYSASLSATGGLAPYSWSIVSGSLHSGLSLSATTGVISGTPALGSGAVRSIAFRLAAGSFVTTTTLTLAITPVGGFRRVDVNRDGMVNVVDVQTLVNVLLQVITPAYPSQGDANNDSLINVVDVQVVVNCILTVTTNCP